ncbi:DUF2225 domain-containing protein [Paenibacillus tarimensis]|uniref:DUF2225 domain-containing protein n=1 Tax=Paenibacillus tarimensis TaxID=416012 RepID=UPI002E1F5FF9
MLEPLFQVKIKCPCCENEFMSSRVRPSFKKSIKTDTDFCHYYKEEVNPEYYVVRVCPMCGFASTENAKQDLNDRQRKLYYEKIGANWVSRDYGGARSWEEALAAYKLALLCAQIIGEKDRVVAGLLHHIAWLYRYKSNEEQELRFLRFALDAYIKVYEVEGVSVNNAKLMYLIGELHRRVDEPYAAVKWFGRVINDKSIVDAAMIRASREQWQLLREEMKAKQLELPEEMEEA